MNHHFPLAGHILDMHDTRGPEHALVVCHEPAGCDGRARIDDSTGRSDKELAAAFAKIGWTIQPTRCPEHANG